MSSSIAADVRADSIYVGGEWIPSTAADRLDVRNPFDLSLVGSVPDGSAADIDAAVRAARAAFDHGPWPRLSPAERATWLELLADELERRGAETAATVTAQNGQPIGMSRVLSGMVPATHLRYYADQVRRFEAEEIRENVSFPGSTVVRHEPVGVCGLIVPWNYPQSLLSAKLAPALAVGCTVVVKPAGETPLDARAVADAADAIGMPPGVINIVTGGRDTGRALVEQPGVDKIAFTGSTAAGRAIAARCGERLIPVTLELGGKSAAVVLDDADAAHTLAQLQSLSFMNSGQTCFLLSRVLVPRARLAEFTEGLAEVARGLVLGNPLDEATQQGPLVSERIRSRVRSLVDAGAAAGARIVTGGRDAPGLEGYFYEPTVVTGVDPRDPLAQEEVFGPVVTVSGYDSDQEAVDLANDTVYGLGGAVFSGDDERALAIARRIETGTIGINGYRPDIGSPFGGYRASGLGREHGPEALTNYVKIKAVYR
ncbi:aldehyde dehydrogenase [Microbacterium sp. HD4P20]|uniref:aldehyde dehydrogenase n=1 Tax=Microbacterium sp. HD4P20 TaxID=2864874 RepID=UPI001C644594|nr:aldehyde dehydrogenase [Microbacterium sp. HD4P20]MCP2636338.1 aldehyde dehydrogenase [Microbacterium sp. HD4P20]